MTTAAAPPTAGLRAADDLRAIRDQWGDLLAAIEHPPPSDWPPHETRGFLNQLAAAALDDEEQLGARIGRLPLTLREHPAPLNLDALDTALAVERDLFASCDAIAARVQRPVRSIRTGHPGRHRYQPDPADHDNPARWHLPTHRSATLVQGAGIASPGSRAHGLHWAAVWLEGRALNDPAGDLFTPLPTPALDQLALAARAARRRIERALGRDTRTTVLDSPCPWCHGILTARTINGHPEQATVTCQTDARDCHAPVPDEHGHRVWRAHTLPTLYTALTAKES